MSANLLALSAIALWATLAALDVALRHAPPVQANLVNYLWPLLMAVLRIGLRLRAPRFSSGTWRSNAVMRATSAFSAT